MYCFEDGHRVSDSTDLGLCLLCTSASNKRSWTLNNNRPPRLIWAQGRFKVSRIHGRLSSLHDFDQNTGGCESLAKTHLKIIISAAAALIACDWGL